MKEQKSSRDKQKGMLQVGGVFVFLTVVAIYFILGGSVNEPNVADAEEQSSGLNMEIPDPDDEYASTGKLDAVHREQSRVNRERSRQLAQSSSFDMLNSLSAPVKDTAEKIDVDALLSKIEDDEPVQEAEERVEEDKSSQPQRVPATSARAGKHRSSVDSLDMEIRRTRREDAMRRVRNGLGTKKDSLLLGLKKKEEKENVEDRIVANNSQSGFIGIGSQQKSREKNTISAVIHGEQKGVRSSSQVKLRLLEDVVIDGVKIPKNTCVIGTVSFGDTRVDITTESINYNGDLLPFHGTIYGTDGEKGMYTGENLVSDVARKSSETAVSESRYKVTSSNSVIGIGRDILDDGKKVVEKWQRKDKVDLPANSKVYIKLK